MQSPYALDFVSLTSPPYLNHIQLPGSVSQGTPLIVNPTYVRCEMSARWRYLMLDFSQNSLPQHSMPRGDPRSRDFASSPGMRVTAALVPQRPYGRSAEGEIRDSIIFKVHDNLGINARDAIGRIYGGLERRDDRVLVGKPNVMMLRLEVRSVADCDVFLMTENSAVAWVWLLVP